VHPEGTGRRRARCAAAQTGAAVGATLLVVLASATAASADTTMAVESGYGGAFAPGWPVPVQVEVTADRLVRGRLEVEVGAGVPVALPVEIPGGSQKRFLVVVPTPGAAQPTRVAARLIEGGRSVATAATPTRPAGDQELVGILPGALAGRPVPGAAPLSVDVGTARFVALGEAELDQAPGSLGPLGTIVMAPADLIRMSPAARQGVLAWVEGGGRLLADGEAGSAVAGLPDTWQPGAARRAPAGAGEVRLTADAVSAGRWANLVEPTGRGSWRADADQFGVDSTVAGSLAGEAGLKVPAVRWLVAFLAVYVIVVGPVLFLAVRRRGRPELAWVVVPLVSLLFTTGSYAAGRGLRSATELVHGSVLNTGEAGSTATTFLGLFSRGGETVRVGLPVGWSAATQPGGGTLSRLDSVTATADGPEARLPLDAGQFGLVTATGPADPPGRLEVTASSAADGQARGTVRNGTPFTLADTVVFVGTSGTPVGTLAPGEEREWRVAGTEGNLGGRPPPEFILWQQRGGVRGTRGDLSLWEAAKRDGGPDFRGPGVAVAAGWTDGFDVPVRVDGRRQAPPGATLVVGRAPVRPVTGPTDLTVRREVVRGDTTGRTGPGFDTVVQFVVAGAAERSLSMRPPTGTFEVWVNGGWSQLGRPEDCQELPGGPPGRVVCRERAVGLGPQVALPAGAAAGDVVHVRLRGVPAQALDFGGLFTLRTAGS
jgi:hypothetical protein